MPVLAPGSSSLRVLHLSDLHMMPNQRLKQNWLRELEGLDPDLVVNTGDNLSHQRSVPAVVQALGDLLARPGLFVFGSNDYFAPKPKNPLSYIFNKDKRITGDPLPWGDLRAAFTERGWLDMTHVRRELEVAGIRIAAAGVDDPHLKRDRYDTVAGTPNPRRPAQARPDALTRTSRSRPVRRRRLRPGARRPHARWSAVPSVLRRAGHQLPDRPIPGQGTVEVGRAHPAARLSGHRHFAVGSGTLLLPPRGNFC